ncbi:MAG: hypothetical protein K8J31_03455 [Anaerolineae bacterium]|nr:hypothetical protein [Anaerolineae bacterium]
MDISPETLNSFLELGGQYALPAAALLRALYSGMRGKLPEGLTQIAAASVLAGMTAVIDPSKPFDWRLALFELTGNTAFIGGLLSFIVVYLIRLRFRSLIFDGFVGGSLGLVAWVVWTQVLLNEWPWWTVPFAIAGGAAAFIALRFSLRQLMRLVRIATYLIVLGVILMIGAGGILAFQWITTQLGM